MFLLVWAGCVVAAAMALQPFGRTGNGAALGLVLGPIGLVISLVWRSNLAGEARAKSTRTHSDERERRCPHCAEWVLAQASVCKHCGRDIEPMKTTGRCPACGQVNVPLDARACPRCRAQFNALSGQKVEEV
jgi:DNA-directed RNA polymerase subunit RPC12/RpoP